MKALARSTSSRRLVPALVASATLMGACASAPPPAPKGAAAAAAAASPVLAAAAVAPRLVDAATMRGEALLTVSLTSLDKLLFNGATLVAPAVPLPIDPAGVRDMMLSQSGLPPDVVANLDFGAPAGAVVVTTSKEHDGAMVVAIAARGPAEATRALAALGREVERRGPFVHVESPSGTPLWLLQDGAVLVFSESVEALARGARLAEESRHAVGEDVTAILHPDAIARANGTDVRTAIAKAVEQMKAQAAQQGGKAINDRAYASITEILQLVADADPIELGFVADPGKGMSLRVRLRARAGSALEKVARESRPYELDPTLLLAAKPPMLVGAWSLGAFMRSQMVHQRDALQTSKAKGATGALALVDAMIAGLAGEASFSFGITKDAPLFAGALGYPLKDAAAAAAIAGALDRLDRDAALALLDAQMGSMPLVDWSFKKETVGKLKAVHYAATLTKSLGLDPVITKKLFGKGAIDVYMAVAGTRLVATFGHDAKANLGRVAAAKPEAPEGALADTLAATKSRDAVFHLDVTPILSLVGTLAKDKDPRAGALARANAGPIPIYGTAGGDGVGRVFSFDLTIPPTAFKNAGAVVRAGMSGGAPPDVETIPDNQGGKKKKR